MSDFVHLHLHSEYSLLDGACRIADIPKTVKRHGQSAVAITDHMNLFGAVEFYIACVKEGIKPIIGCEADVSLGDDYKDTGHLTLLAENETGYKNLMYLISCANIEGNSNKSEPRISFDNLRKHSDGLIALSGCGSGLISRSLINGDIDGASEYICKFIEIFGKENFFFELQNNGMPEQSNINHKLADFSRIYNIGLAATNNVHYIKKEEAEIRRILKCIRENVTLDDIYEENRMNGEADELYLKNTQEMTALFSNGRYVSAIENTVKIAERCKLNLDFSETHLPKYQPSENSANFNSQEYLRKLSLDGLENYIEKFKKDNETIDIDLYRKRLEYEIETIVSMGYTDYYLIVWDFINYAKKNGIPVGPGRGSGAGSLTAFCIGITEIDSIKYDLLFERFLNPERVSMPDFDIDLCQERRVEVIDYVMKKYEGRSAHITTFGTMAARSAVRDAGRAMRINHDDVDCIAKLIPPELGVTLDRALEESKDLKQRYYNTDYTRELIDTAKKLEGLTRHTSVHAAGIVITDKPIHEYTPLAVNADTNTVTTQYAMDTIAELGLLKIDFLGSRYLTVIDNAVREIKKNRAYAEFDIDSINLDDSNVYKLYASGHTEGIFQFESAGMKNLLVSLKPESFEDITAAVALFRPGPMDSIPTYIKNRHNKSEISYKLPQLKPILETTYGCIVYQEQVMQIFRTLAGYSYGRADIVRRAVSKKKADVMEEEREHFITGCIANDIDKTTATEIFNEMAEFANYAFNKSHAVAYAIVSYRTAYLKRYYPEEFFAAMLSSVLNDPAKSEDYIRGCGKLRIKIYPPDINRSEAKFTVEGGGIRYGLLAVKNIGTDFAKNIVKERAANGKYLSLSDFLERLGTEFDYDINKRQTEALIKCGAFDTINGGAYNRDRLAETYERLIDAVNHKKRKTISGQVDLFMENQEVSEMEILYLKIDDTQSRVYKKVLSLIGIFDGKTEVKVYEEKTKKIFARRDTGVDLNDVFINELKELLGEDNVRVVKKRNEDK